MCTRDVCRWRQHNCINPIFPGLQDLEKLEAANWTCPDPESKPTLKAGRSFDAGLGDFFFVCI